jgi:hypothetical protein
VLFNQKFFFRSKVLILILLQLLYMYISYKYKIYIINLKFQYIHNFLYVTYIFLYNFVSQIIQKHSKTEQIMALSKTIFLKQYTFIYWYFLLKGLLCLIKPKTLFFNGPRTKRFKPYFLFKINLFLVKRRLQPNVNH